MRTYWQRRRRDSLPDEQGVGRNRPAGIERGTALFCIFTDIQAARRCVGQSSSCRGDLKDCGRRFRHANVPAVDQQRRIEEIEQPGPAENRIHARTGVVAGVRDDAQPKPVVAQAGEDRTRKGKNIEINQMDRRR